MVQSKNLKTQLGPLKVIWAPWVKNDKGLNVMGLFNSFNYEIAIDDTIAHGIKRQTLLHELIHVLQYNAGLKFNEQQADTLASGLYDLFVRNPKLIEFIMEKEK